MKKGIAKASKMKFHGTLGLATLLSQALLSYACDWKRNGSCYTLILDKQNFFAAETECQILAQGHLVRADFGTQ